MSCMCFECVGDRHEPTEEEYNAWLWWEAEILLLRELNGLFV